MAEPEIITTHAELLAALDALPPPADGFARVFRGQNHDFGAMTPTALRTGVPSEQLWPIYAAKLAQAITTEPADDLDMFLLWVNAIKQHYGPGTEFLDVTHSPGVAVWFALHEMKWTTAKAIYGSPGPYDPLADVVGEHQMARYVRYEREPSFLYAFDAIQGTSSPDREHGRLFDLALAPPPFSSSARIQAQRACLIFADVSRAGGDLSPLSVPGTPLRVAWPMDGCEEAGWPTNTVIPPVAEDDWYARFVAVPLAPALSKSTDQTTFDHPINVTVFIPEGSDRETDQASLDDLTWRFVVQRPPLLYAQLRATDDPNTPGPVQGRLAEATPLLLEGPMMTTIAPTERLNHGVLMTGLADCAPTYEYDSGAEIGEASLTNVFIELSVLDADAWEHVETPEEVDTVRGIWLVRKPDRFFVTIFTRAATIGPVEIVYLDSTRSFAMRGTDESAEWTPLQQIPEIERPFLKALAFVRSLSPGWKLSASAQIETDAPGGAVKSLATVDWALGKLVSLHRLEGAVNMYFTTRMWDEEEPFYGAVRLGSPVQSGGISVEGQPYADIDPQELLSAETIDALAKLPPPS